VVRGAALGVLAVAIAAGSAGVPLILIVCFVLGTGETLADTASAAFLPAVVPPEARPRANSLLYANFNLINQFAAKPIGAWLFVVATFLPFGVNAVTFGVSALLVASIRPLPAPPPTASRRLRAEIAAGVRFLFAHRLLRTLAVTMAVANLVFCAAFAVFVLYAFQRLRLSDLGYGVLLIAFAAGGFLGTLVAPMLMRRVGTSWLLRAGLLVEVALHATLALTTVPLVAAGMIVVFGVHTTVWGVVVTTIRQRDTPYAMFGRVSSVYSLIDVGGAAAGTLLGGLYASAFGLTTTYATAAVAMLGVALFAWRPLGAG
jgi:predicted MFS family arabinose efflux permease